MDKAKRAKLVKAGWQVGSVQSFLGLSDAEVAYLDLKIALAATLRETRVSRCLTQVEAAARLSSSQSRLAKMEAADASVSIDLLVRSVFGLGGGPADIARALRAKAKPRVSGA